MKIYPEQLEKNLNTLYPVYLVAGDEPLQKMEAVDAIRAYCKQQGLLERQIIEEAGSSNPLTDQAGTMSLFAESRLLEWRFDKSIKKAHGEFIQSFINSEPQDVLLITAPKLSSEKRLAWYKTLEQKGLVVEAWPVPAERLGSWLSTRARKLGVALEPDALATLIERCEGNLLAAQQDLQMLSLLSDGQPVSSDNIKEYVGDNARYSVYELSDACLSGQTDRALRMLATLQAEGVYPLVPINQLLRECQLLADWAEQMAQGETLANIMQSQRVWPKRQKILQVAMSKGSVKKWYALVQRLTYLDKSAKGQADADVWQELAHVVCLMTNCNPLRGSGKRVQPKTAASQVSAEKGLSDLKKSLGMN